MPEITNDSIKKMLDTLRSSDSQKIIYNTILQLKDHVINTEMGLKCFKENNGFTCVLQFLAKPNEKILNASLGVLADCCEDERCRKEMILKGNIRHLMTILRSINNDKIHYRCCKLIGNLARSSEDCSILISKGFCDLLIPILQGNPHVGTQFVALRCILHLWSGASMHEKKIMAQSGVFASCVRFIDSSNNEVQRSALRLIFCISKLRFDGVLKGLLTEDILKQLISLSSDNSAIVLRIIYYLSEFTYFHFRLVKVGALEPLFSYVSEMDLENCDSTTEAKMDLVLRSIYRLSFEPKCRERLCSIPNVFQTFLNIIEKSSFLKFKKYSVLILSSYIYNDKLLHILVKQHLIPAFVTYIKAVIDIEGNLHEHDGIKDDFLCFTECASPDGASPVSDSEVSFSFSLSPTNDYSVASPSFSEDSVYSSVYSPSQDNMDDFPDVEEDDNFSAVDSCISDSPMIFQDDEVVKSVAEERIFNVMKRVAVNNQPYFDLCQQRTWDALLDYMTLMRKTSNQTTSVLISIAGNPIFFAELMKSKFALIVHKRLCRPEHKNCSCCGELLRAGNEILSKYTEVAESLYGSQFLMYELEKQKNVDYGLLTLTIPLIVNTVSQLDDYLLGRSKLWESMLKNLDDDDPNDNSIFEEKIASLHTLCKNLFLENTRDLVTVCKKCNVASLTKEATITFLLDDGSMVTANKNSICEKSEFFEAMFRCGFKEAKESMVRLSSISADCLATLFRLLYSYCECLLPKNVQVLLELIVQCDRFLLPDLSEKLLHVTMNHVLDYKNAHLVYDWAVENCSFLSLCNWSVCESVIKYALAEDIVFKQRVFVFRRLLKSQYKSSVLNHINGIILSQFASKEVVLKSKIKVSTTKRQKIG